MAKSTNKAPLSKEQKTLRALAIICILLAVFYLALTVVLGGLYVLYTTTDEASLQAILVASGEGASELAAMDSAAMADQIGLSVFSCVLSFIFSLAMGITGVRASRKPRKTMPFIVVTAIAIVISVVQFVISLIVADTIDMLTVAISLADLFFMVLALYIAVQIKRGYKEGIITEDVASEKTDLGFIAVVYALMVLNVLTSIVALMFTLRSDMSMGFYTVLELANVVLDGVAVWLIYQRSKFTRTWVVGVCTLDIVLTLIYMLATQTFTVPEFFSTQLFNIFCALYFAFAKRPRIALVNDLAWPFLRSLKQATRRSLPLKRGVFGASRLSSSASSAWWATGWKPALALA